MMPNEPIHTREPLQAYLNEIRNTALLTKEEEISLAKRIKRGDKSARDLMIRANLRLVVKIAHHYNNCGLPLLDLISEGNLGLVKAVERFDPKKGAKFSTYAAWWIKQSIRRGLANQAKTIRLPVHMMEKLQRMRRLERQLQEELGREPSHEELADELHIPVAKISMMKQSMLQPLSLDNTLDSETGEGSLGDIIGDDNAVDPSERIESSNMNETVQDALKTLDDRALAILSLRFGLDGTDEQTLEEIGKRFNVTRERIRQLQNQALSKIRKNIQKRESSKMRKGYVNLLKDLPPTPDVTAPEETVARRGNKLPAPKSGAPKASAKKGRKSAKVESLLC